MGVVVSKDNAVYQQVKCDPDPKKVMAVFKKQTTLKKLNENLKSYAHIMEVISTHIKNKGIILECWNDYVTIHQRERPADPVDISWSLAEYLVYTNCEGALYHLAKVDFDEFCICIAPNNEGNTVLHVFAKKNNFAGVKVLLDLKADTKKLNNDRKTAVQLATDDRIKRLFEDYQGAQESKKALAKMQRALEAKMEKNQEEIKSMIVEYQPQMKRAIDEFKHLKEEDEKYVLKPGDGFVDGAKKVGLGILR